MRPVDVEVDEVHRWVAPLLARCRRVLEVGCGAGDLARRLAAGGLEVTALDLALEAPSGDGVTWVETDFLGFAADPFDAILFTRSLHHIHPLDAAIERALGLVRHGGLLVVEEFDREAPDLETARWYQEAQDLLAAAGLHTGRHGGHHGGHHAGHQGGHHVDGGTGDDPLDRWRREHEHTPPLHTGSEMIAAIDERFARLEVRRGAALHRSIASGLEVSERGALVARQLQASETRRVHAGTLAPVGLRITGLAPPG